MRCDAKPQNMSPAVPHDQQSIEQAKRDCRHDEHIHRSDPISVVAEECPPALGWRVSSPDHVVSHARLSDIDAELEEFSMDPRRSPQRIGNAHLADMPSPPVSQLPISASGTANPPEGHCFSRCPLRARSDLAIEEHFTLGAASLARHNQRDCS
jgi:hypothetical protein